MYPATINMEEMFQVSDDFVFSGASSTWTSLDDGATGTNTIDAVAGGQISIVTAAARTSSRRLSALRGRPLPGTCCSSALRSSTGWPNTLASRPRTRRCRTTR